MSTILSFKFLLLMSAPKTGTRVIDHLIRCCLHLYLAIEMLEKLFGNLTYVCLLNKPSVWPFGCFEGYNADIAGVKLPDLNKCIPTSKCMNQN